MTELEYGINVANKYDLLFGDEDPTELLSKTQAADKKKKAEPAGKAPAGVLKEKAAKGTAPAGKAPAGKPEAGKAAPAGQKAPQQGDKKPGQGPQQQQQRPPRSAPQGGRPEQGKENTSRPPRPEGGQQRSPGFAGQGPRGPRGPRPEGSAPPRRPPMETDFAPVGGDQEVPEARTGFGGRGGRGGQGGFRGRYNQFPREQREAVEQSDGRSAPTHARGREYERHSGTFKTGVKPMPKREGGGAHNWGTFKDEAELGDAVAHGTPAAEVVPAKEGEEGAATEAVPTEGAPEVPEEPQERQLTLKEYMEEEERRRLRPQYATRQANEGEPEQKVFQKMRRVQKEKTSADGMVEIVEYVEVDVDEEGQVPGSKKSVGGPFQLVFAPSARVGGGERGGPRGGRGGARGAPRGAGAGGRGGQRGGPGGRQAPPPQDEANFPALG